MFWQNYLRLCNEIEKAPNVVANEIGIKSSGTVTGWKNGAMPRQQVLRRLSDYFGVSVASLLEENDLDEPEKPATETGDGLTAEQQNLIDLISRMTDYEVSVLLAFARAQVENRKSQDAPSQSE